MLDSKTKTLLKNRDRYFLEELFKNTNPYLFKMLAGNRIYAEQAQDLVQSSWEVFLTNIDQFKGQSQVKVYIAGILINKIREWRRQQKKVVYEEDSEKIFEQNFDSEGWWAHKPADPHKLIESKETLRHIEDCLEGLSEMQREAFILKVVQQEETEVICNIMQVNVTHIGVLIHRAKDKLRQCLEGKMS